jgi:hypothetical protein
MNPSPESDELFQFKNWINYEAVTNQTDNQAFDFATNESSNSAFSYNYIDSQQMSISENTQILQSDPNDIHLVSTTDQVESQLEILNSIDYFDLSCEKREPVLHDNFLGAEINNFAFNPTQPAISCFNSQLTEPMPLFLNSLGDGINFNDLQQQQNQIINPQVQPNSHQAKLDKKMLAFEKRMARQKERDRKKALKELNKSKNMQPVTYNFDLSLFSKTTGRPGRKKKDASANEDVNKSSSNCSLANDLAEFATLNHFSKSSNSQKSTFNTKKQRKTDLMSHSSASMSNCSDQFTHSMICSQNTAHFNGLSDGSFSNNVQLSEQNLLQRAQNESFFTNFYNYQSMDDFNFINQTKESYF